MFVWDRTTGTTTQVTEGNLRSQVAQISGNGLFVSFSSFATYLVPGDTNGFNDIFVWSRSSGTTTRLSDGNDYSYNCDISDNGRFLTFTSDATDLVAGDTNGQRDVFLIDRVPGTTTRVTNGNATSYRPSLAADGSHVAFTSEASNLVPGDTNGQEDVFSWARATSAVTRITDGNDRSYTPELSDDGRFLVFSSEASNLDPGDTNGRRDIFRWDRLRGGTLRITDGNQASFGPSITADGRRVAFASEATDLVPGPGVFDADEFVWDDFR
ncbi:hypothetical protein BH24ACT4_BH24ACT4_15370 [soil metagenome]